MLICERKLQAARNILLRSQQAVERRPGFYQTPLHLLLHDLGAHSIILTGLATNSCILCTAHHANVRDFKVTVVSDCCASRWAREHKEAIENIREMASARVVTLESLRINHLKGRHGKTS